MSICHLHPVARPAFAVLAPILAALSLAFPSSVLAQPHGPMGGGQAQGQPELASPLLDAKLEVGTVFVQVVAGSTDKPLEGVEVILSGAAQKTATTDAAGQLQFSGIEPGLYDLKAKRAGALMQSERFIVPTSGGVSVVLSTLPMGPDRGGRPSARMMSGRARPEANDPSGQLTVRSIQGELEQSEFGGLQSEIPDGAKIHLVGMHADGRMTVETKVVNKAEEGRVVFDNLARDNSIAYYALTVFERVGGSDRLMTSGLDLPPQIGSRMMFAGATKNSAMPGFDDLVQLSGTDADMPGPGEVLVRMFAEDSQTSFLVHSSKVELIQIGAKGEARSANVGDASPATSSIMGRSGPMKGAAGTELGQVSFYAVRPSTDAPIAGATIRIELAESPAAAPGSAKSTDAKGMAFFPELVVGTSYVAIATLHGSEVRSEPFTPKADQAQSVAFAFEWPEQGIREAKFSDVPHGDDKVYIAKVVSDGRQFLSMPFQLTPEKGAAVGIFMYPELLFSMHGGAELDDSRLWFQTRMSIANPGIAPLQVDAKGLIIPLPKGFLGASVADEMTSRIGVESGKGFLWRGAVPPGQRDFVATFAIPVDDGKATFDMALPYGLRGGRIVLEDLPGMELRTPQGAEVKQTTQPNGRKFVEMPSISIAPEQRFVFGVSGLPQHSILQKRIRIAVGLLAVVLIGWALYVILFARRRPEEVDPELQALEMTRERLMAELVALESERRHQRETEKPYDKKRERLNTRLADVYRKIDDHKTSVRNSN